MRIPRLIPFIALALALSACENALVVTDERLVGTWLLEEQPVPPGRMREQVAFGAGGSFVRDVRFYGYNGQSATELSGYYRLTGEYRLNGDRLEIRPVREISWDALVGGQPSIRDLSGEWGDAGTVRIEGDTMIRTFFTYPADAPVETTVRYHRIAED